MPLSLSLPLSARRYTGHEAMPFFEAFFPKAMFARRWRGSSMCRPCGPWSSFACSAKIAPVMSSCWERTMAAICREEAAYVPPLNALEEIARYPYGAISQLRAEYRLSLAGGQEKNRALP